MGNVGVGLTRTRSAIQDQLKVPEGALLSVFPRLARSRAQGAAFLGLIAAGLGGSGAAAASSTGSIFAKSASAQSVIGDVAFILSDDPLQREWDKPYGNRYTEFRSMHSKYGLPIARGSSSIRIAGNIIWMKDVEERVQVKLIPFTSDGVPPPDVDEDRVSLSTPTSLFYREYHYYASFAIAFVDTNEDLSGEIVRLWADGKIVWDIRDINTSEPAQLVDIRLRKYAEYVHYKDSVIEVYNGTTDNVRPNNTIADDVGAANTPNYVGITYAVFTNLDLNHFGNKIPQIHAEISHNAIPTVMGKGMVFDNNFQTDEVTGQHFTSDKYVIGTTEPWWLDLNIYDGIATKGPELIITGTNIPGVPQSEPGHSASELTTTKMVMDRWGAVYSYDITTTVFPFLGFPNKGGYRKYVTPDRESVGTAAVLESLFGGDIQLSVPDRIVLGSLKFIYQTDFKTSQKQPVIYSQSTQGNPFASETLNKSFVLLAKEGGAPLTPEELNFGGAEQNSVRIFADTGVSFASVIPREGRKFHPPLFLLGDNTRIPGPDNGTQALYNKPLFAISPTPGAENYDKWNPEIIDQGLILHDTAEPDGSLFSDSGEKGKLLCILTDGFLSGSTVVRLDVKTLDDDDGNIFDGSRIGDLIESEVTTGGLQVSDFTFEEGLQNNKIVGKVPSPDVVGTAWGYFDAVSMSRVGVTYNQSTSTQIEGELPFSPQALIGPSHYIAAIRGVLAMPFFGIGNPSFFLFRSVDNWQTLDVVVTRLILPFIKYIDAADIDVSDLSSIIVKGYFAVDDQNMTEYIKRLQDIYLFDVVEIDGKLVFKRRGTGDTPIVISDTLLEGQPKYNSMGILYRANMAELKYTDFDLDLQQHAQRARMLNNNSLDSRNLVVPVVFDKDEAAQRIDILLKVSHAESKEVSFNLSRKYSFLVPSDIISIDEFVRLRIVKIDVNTDGSLSVVGINESLVAYSSNSVGDTVSNFKSKRFSTSEIVIIPIEVPYTKNSDNTLGEMFFAGFQRFNDEQIRIIGHTEATKFGYIGAAPSTTFIGRITKCVHKDMSTFTSYLQPARLPQREGPFDYSLTLELVHLHGDAPKTRTEDEVFKGRNVVAIGKELVGYLNVEKLSANRYRLSGLLRGMFSTEYAINKHSLSEYLVEFHNLPSIKYEQTEIGKVLDVLGTTQSITSETYTTAINTGLSFRPLPPVNFEFSKSGSDIVITWDRRNRYAGRMLSLEDIPAGDTTYRIEIVDYRDNTIIRTFDLLSSETITYTSAEQVTDFGVNQDNISILAYQVNIDFGDSLKKYESSRFATSEYIRDFSTESLGAATGLTEIDTANSTATIVTTRSGNNVVELDSTDVSIPYYYFLDDIYSISSFDIELTFQFDEFASASGSILRVVFGGIDNTIINYVEINKTSVKYLLYSNLNNTTLEVGSISVDTLKLNTWYTFKGKLKDTVFTLLDIVESHKTPVEKVIVNNTHSILKSIAEPSILNGGYVGIGNLNRNIKTRIGYIKVI